jgi:phosphatidylinositol glycan class Q protein
VGILFKDSPHPIPKILELCQKEQLQVLGTTNSPNKPTSFDRSNISLYTDGGSVGPRVYCPKEHGISVQIVTYIKPEPTRMQYMSLDPISLALADKSFYGGVDGADSTDTETKMLVEKLKLHTVRKHIPNKKETILPVILNQINCSWELTQMMLKNANLIGLRQRRALSVSERVVESASNLYTSILMYLWQLVILHVYPMVKQTFILGLLVHRVTAEFALRVLEWRPNAESVALKDISATAQQVDIRLQQFCYWPIQYSVLRERRFDWDSVTTKHPDYIRFYNSLWLVANDIIIGIALGSYILDNADGVTAAINVVLDDWSLKGLKSMIMWLTDWPAGLKLNNELAFFLGELFLWVIEYWSNMVENFRPMLPHAIYFIGFSSFAGASMPIALFSDLLSLLTIHIYSFYVASARIFHWQLTIIISLFHLFRGKKHNVLRNRIDSCDYDLDQLLLGTILFTLLFFLLPTVVVFYLTFASARMAIILLKAVLDTLLACLNHFPLFALMLRVKDPQRLPGMVAQILGHFCSNLIRRHLFRAH